MKNNNSEKKLQHSSQKMTRKQAILKGGKYAAFTAASMLIILSPKETQAQSPAHPPLW